MTFSPCFLWFVPDDSFSVHSGTVAHRAVAYSRCGDHKSTETPIFISAAESVPAGTAVPVPVGSGPGLSHKRTGPRLSCPACGTTLHELNAPGNNLPVRPAPTTR